MEKIKSFLSDLYHYEKKPNGLAWFENLFLVFFAGCVVGWIYEELFYYFVEGKLLNSGFFYGPYLPVYGFGCLFILYTTRYFKKHWWIVFGGSMFVTGLLEYVTGYVMYAIWQKRWWDYRGLFLNIDGYVCLRSVLTFAVGGIGVIYFIDPLIRKFTVDGNAKARHIITGVLFAVMLLDVIMTFAFSDHTPPISNYIPV